MGSIFKPSKNTTTTIQKDNPWDDMPKWLKDSYRDDIKRREGILDSAEGLEFSVEGLAPREERALEKIIGGTQNANEFTNRSISDLNRAADQYLNPGDIDRALGVSDNRTTDLAMRLNRLGGNLSRDSFADIEGLDRSLTVDPYEQSYESDYTDAVVDSTLTRSDRDFLRQQQERELAAAAVGGTSNTRTAVEQAIAADLNNLTRAEIEAGLRDDAFRFSREMGLQRGMSEADQAARAADFDLSEEIARTGYGLDQFGAKLDQFGMLEGLNDARFNRQMAADDFGLQLFDANMGLAGLREDLNQSKWSRKMQQEGVRGELGATNRRIRQARRDIPQDELAFQSSLLTGSNTKAPPPQSQSSTQTSEQPGPSPFSQIMGTAAQVAGVYAGFPA